MLRSTTARVPLTSRFLALNRSLSQRWSDVVAAAPPGYHFLDLLHSRLEPHTTVIDVGGGKRPLLDPCIKSRLGIRVIGVDISAEELSRAPADAYDERIVGDAATAELPRGVDLVYSSFVVEHIRDVRSLFENLYRALKPGGSTIHQIPNRHCLPSILNRLLPHATARKVLFGLRPSAEGSAGFRAYYDHCSPAALARLMRDVGFVDVSIVGIAFATSYFKAFFPAHLLASCWGLAMQTLALQRGCTRFVVAGRRPVEESQERGRMPPSQD